MNFDKYKEEYLRLLDYYIETARKEIACLEGKLEGLYEARSIAVSEMFAARAKANETAADIKENLK